MQTENLSAVLHKTGDLRIEHRPIPEPKDNEVQIRMSAIGICGSDIHYWTRGRIGDFIVTGPMVLGHEGAGVVSKVGQKVTSLKIGDRVAIEPGVPCHYCEFCKSGKYNLCVDVVFCGNPPVNGSLCRYFTHAAEFCYKLPENVSLEEGALLEPLSVAVHACRRAGVTLGSVVFVSGAGPIGLMSLLTAKAMGASKVIITDLVESRLQVAKSLGADEVYQIGTNEEATEIAKGIEATLGEMPAITIECSGAQGAINSAILVFTGTKSGGCICMVGLGPPEISLPIVNAAVREIDIRGVLRYANCFPTALAMIASGKVDVKNLITHHFTIEDSVKAFETARDGTGGTIKVIIHP